MWRTSAASQAGRGKGKRTREVLSMTRVPSVNRQADGGELGSGERMCRAEGAAHCQNQPVSGGVQDQAHLVGAWTAAAGAVGGGLGFYNMIKFPAWRRAQ